MTDRIYQRFVFAFLLAVILAQAIFAAFPGIDLAVSARFADGLAGFPWADGWPAMANLVLRRLGEAVVVGLLVLCLYGAASGQLRGDGLRGWIFVPLSAILASGGIVNLVLKAHVGRARPAHVADFGGEAQFTPAWQVTDQCGHNCSFTSGEVSLAASLALTLLLLLWPGLKGPVQRFLAVGLAAAYVGTTAILRIGLGRHFLSDTVFSALISVAVVLVLYPLLRISRARLVCKVSQPLAVGRRLSGDVVAQARLWLKRPA